MWGILSIGFCVVLSPKNPAMPAQNGVGGVDIFHSVFVGGGGVLLVGVVLFSQGFVGFLDGIKIHAWIAEAEDTEAVAQGL